MWQQSDCNIKNATRQNPSGCLNDLYPFVITNYTNIIDPATNPPAIDDNGGGNSMAFYNVLAGDVPVLKRLADQFSMSDNFHQPFLGGTGADHVMLGTGDAFFWSDGDGNPTTPPSHIANPNPQPAPTTSIRWTWGSTATSPSAAMPLNRASSRSCSTCTLSLITLIRIANRNIST
jgi:hypothetical protein